MPFITATVENRRPTDAVRILIVKDAFTFIFILSDSTIAPNAKATSADRTSQASRASTSPYAVFTSSDDTEHPHGVSGAEGRHRSLTVKEHLWMHATTSPGTTRYSPLSPEAAAVSDEQASRYPCCQKDKSAQLAPQRSPVPAPSPLWRRERISLATATNSLAELRATEFLATTEAEASTTEGEGPPGKAARSARGASFDLHHLHVVREYADGHLVDVWCVFECGCCALATFALRGVEAGLSRRVRLEACVWVPQLVNTAEMDGSEETTWLAIEAAPTALVRRPQTGVGANVKGNEGEGEEMLLLTPYRTADSAVPKLYYVNLHCAEQPEQLPPIDVSLRTSAGNNDPCRATRWQLHAQGWFDTSRLFRVPLSSASSPVEIPAASEKRDRNAKSKWSSTLHCCTGVSLRSVRWLPGTWEHAHRFPLLALLYATPAVSAGDPCLDTLSVCSLTESDVSQRQHNPSSTTAGATTPPCKRVTGHVSSGPWSVCALTLAHPSFVFCTTLAAAFAKATPSGAHGMESNGEGVRRAARAASTAAALFHSALCAVVHAPTEVLGVFQRPAQEPYAASCLLRAAHRQWGLRSAHGVAETGRVAAGPEQRDHKGKDDAFAFVLYSNDGEAARCALDGYVECADAVFTRGGVQGGNGLLAVDGGVQLVGQICALLSEPASATDAVGGGAYTAVLLSVLAQPMCGETLGNAGNSAAASKGCRQRWHVSVQVSHRISVGLTRPVSAATNSPLPVLVAVDRIVCWDLSAVSSEGLPAAESGGGRGSSSNVWVMIRGFAAFREGSVDVLYDGVLTLAKPHVSSSDAERIDASAATGVAGAIPNALSSASTGYSTDIAKYEVLHRVAAVDLAHSFLTGCAVDSTSMELLTQALPATITVATYENCRCPPLPSSQQQQQWGSVAIPSSVIPVALAWSHRSSKEKAVSSAAVVVAASTATTTDTNASAPAGTGLAECAAQMDVVAVLRGGSIIGWRCDREFQMSSEEGNRNGFECPTGVLRLGVLHYPRRTTASALGDRTAEFLTSLLSTGEGLTDVHMEVVLTKKTGARAATVLLVIAVGPLIGVVRLHDGYVEHVLDVRSADSAQACTDAVAPSSSADLRMPSSPSVAAAASAYVSALQFQLLPRGSTPYSIVCCDGEESSFGEAFSFAWSGVVTLRHAPEVTAKLRSSDDVVGTVAAHRKGTVKIMQQRNVQRQMPVRTMTCVIQLAVLTWADVVAPCACVATADGTVLQRALLLSTGLPGVKSEGDVQTAVLEGRSSLLSGFTSPSPIVFLRMSAGWLGEDGMDAACREAPRPSPSAWKPCPFIGWVDAACERWRESGLELKEPSLHTSKATSLRVCDDALLHALWPAGRLRASTEPASRDSIGGRKDLHLLPPVRDLRWSCDVADGAARPLNAKTETTATTAATPEAVVSSVLRYPVLAHTVLVNNCAVVFNRTLMRVSALTTDAQHTTASAVTAGTTATVKDCEWDGWNLQRVLYVASVRSATATPFPPVAFRPSHTALHDSLSVVMCTALFALENGAAHSPSAGSGGRSAQRQARVASFLVCSLPLPLSDAPSSVLSADSDTTAAAATAGATHERAKATVAAATYLSRLTWHWLPLPAVDVGTTAVVRVGVTCVLPLLTSPSCATDAVAPPAQETAPLRDVGLHAGKTILYCEGVAADSSSPSAAAAGAVAPLFVQGRLAIKCDGLRAALVRSMSADTCATQGDAERVFLHTEVDPTLVCWESISCKDIDDADS
jgi:hypothetical protein